MKLEARVERLEAGAGSGNDGREDVRRALHRLTIGELHILRTMAEIESAEGAPEEWPEGGASVLRKYEQALAEVS